MTFHESGRTTLPFWPLSETSPDEWHLENAIEVHRSILKLRDELCDALQRREFARRSYVEAKHAYRDAELRLEDALHLHQQARDLRFDHDEYSGEDFREVWAEEMQAEQDVVEARYAEVTTQRQLRAIEWEVSDAQTAVDSAAFHLRMYKTAASESDEVSRFFPNYRGVPIPCPQSLIQKKRL